MDHRTPKSLSCTADNVDCPGLHGGAQCSVRLRVPRLGAHRYCPELHMKLLRKIGRAPECRREAVRVCRNIGCRAVFHSTKGGSASKGRGKERGVPYRDTDVDINMYVIFKTFTNSSIFC